MQSIRTTNFNYFPYDFLHQLPFHIETNELLNIRSNSFIKKKIEWKRKKRNLINLILTYMIFFSSVPDGSLVRDIRIKNNYIISGMIHKSAAHGSRKKSVSFSTSFAYILSLYALLPFIVSALLLRFITLEWCCCGIRSTPHSPQQHMVSIILINCIHKKEA